MACRSEDILTRKYWFNRDRFRAPEEEHRDWCWQDTALLVAAMGLPNLILLLALLSERGWL